MTTHYYFCCFETAISLTCSTVTQLSKYGCHDSEVTKKIILVRAISSSFDWINWTDYGRHISDSWTGLSVSDFYTYLLVK
jgi:hypothetical protein